MPAGPTPDFVLPLFVCPVHLAPSSALSIVLSIFGREISSPPTHGMGIPVKGSLQIAGTGGDTDVWLVWSYPALFHIFGSHRRRHLPVNELALSFAQTYPSLLHLLLQVSNKKDVNIGPSGPRPSPPEGGPTMQMRTPSVGPSP